MTKLSIEQEEIINLPLQPIAVTACAGSGKTRTAVHRLAAMRGLHQDDHSLVALLSFSNIAVDTFRNEYAASARDQKSGRRAFAVEIDTMDGFITTNVLRPHSHRIMSCGRTPYLVDGREPFLKTFTVFDGKRTHPTVDLGVALQNGTFVYTLGRNAHIVSARDAERAVIKLGAVGAFTHASARYWVLRTLQEQPFVLRALVRRYPHILIDEAQDIGPEHQAILELMIGQGSQVSLIGDPHQGIYEFAHANGAFLAGYGGRPGVDDRRLSINYRSVPSIVTAANGLTGRTDTAACPAEPGRHGTYYVPYKSGARSETLATFHSILKTAGIDDKGGVVLCRSSDLASEWSGERDGQGVGVVRCFAKAAIYRDLHWNFHQAFSEGCAGIIGLLASEHGGLKQELARAAQSETIQLSRAIWSFLRDSGSGLPSATLIADTVWHPLMCERVRKLLSSLEVEFGMKPAENLGHKLAKKSLENRPLVETPDLSQANVPTFRVSTVHKVKGESLEAVLYVAKKGHVRALLDGTGTEEGRIGYVALTRARNLFVLAVPDNCLTEFEAPLRAKGFLRAGLSMPDSRATGGAATEAFDGHP
jgi:hypothetical protein